MRRKYILLLFVVVCNICLLSASPYKPEHNVVDSTIAVNYIQDNPIAVNDTFILAYGCKNIYITDNLLKNDIVDSIQTYVLSNITTSDELYWFSYSDDGDFFFRPEPDFRGTVNISYTLTNINDSTIYSEAILTIIVASDFDCDSVADFMDMDMDNDGILNIHEGDINTDTDGDSNPDCKDIDSDNDGICDIVEWQRESFTYPIIIEDTNKDGWLDIFDSNFGGDYYEQIDTDLDGIADYLDEDSDNDGVSDFIEAYKLKNDTVATISLLAIDSDGDGLDDICDSTNSFNYAYNSFGSNCILNDFNNNGIRDWRDNLNYFETIDPLDLKIRENKIKTFPNPCKLTCNIEILLSDEERIKQENIPYENRIFSLNGRLVQQTLSYNSNYTLNVDNLKNGTYLLLVKSLTQDYYSKVVVLH